MVFARVEGGEVVSTGTPPRLVRDPATGDIVADFTLSDSRTPEAYASVGWFEIQEVDEPRESEAGTWEDSIKVVNGIPTQVWTLRPWSAEELTAKAAEKAEKTIEDALDTALTDLQTIIDTPNASLSAAPAIKTIARAVRRLIRLQLRRLDGTT